MIDEFKAHQQHYLILAIILGAGLVAILLFRVNEVLKNTVILALAAAYVAWGIYHHKTSNHLRLKVVLEYLLVALLGVLLLRAIV
ncbi:MAG: hypothetical protein HYS86_01055 [Candidatus Chisholmbacteria bacterium]|nr:hypothetical protein [Candidatus Chisholmbacteria bacterium]